MGVLSASTGPDFSLPKRMDGRGARTAAASPQRAHREGGDRYEEQRRGDRTDKPEPRADRCVLTEQCEQVKTIAGDRYASIEMNTLVHAVQITEDRSAVPQFPNISSMQASELHKIPAVLSGTPTAIAEDLHRYRET